MSNIIETIMAGGKLNETVEILYKDNNGRVVTTETEPYEIRGGTYICWCYLRNKLVEIPLQRIVDAVLLGKSYTPKFHVKFDQ